MQNQEPKAPSAPPPEVIDLREAYDKEIAPLMEEISNKCEALGITYVASFVAAAFPTPLIPGVADSNRINHCRHYSGQGKIHDDTLKLFSEVMVQRARLVFVPGHWAIAGIPQADEAENGQEQQPESDQGKPPFDEGYPGPEAEEA